MADKSSLEGGLQYVPAIVLAQIIYLDFDGELTSYNGEILTLDNVEVQDALLTAERINNIVTTLNERYAAQGIQFVTQRPATADYSTIFVGKTDAFDQYGTFKGLAETIDEGNANKTDKAFVNLDTTATDTEIIATIAHETDHLTGTLNHGGEGLQAYAACYDVSSGRTASGITLYYDSMYVSSGGTATSTTVNSYGDLSVGDGGTATSTTVNEGGRMYVYDGGTATEVRENGGYVYVADGANVTFVPNTISGLVLSNAAATLHSGTTVTSTTVNKWGYLDVYAGGTATSTTVNSGGDLGVHSGGTATSTTVNSWGSLYVDDGGTATSTTVNKWGSLYAHSGGTVTSTTVNNGYLSVADGGTVTATTVNEWGHLAVYFGGTATATTVNYEGSVFVFSGGTATAITANSGATLNFTVAPDTYIQGTSAGSGFEIKNGYVSGYTVNSSGRLYVSSGGTATSTTVDGGSMYVSGGGTATATTVNDGYLYVHSGGTATSTTVNSGGGLVVSFGGTATATTVNDGYLYVHSGGTANDTTVNSGGSMYVDSGGWADNVVVFTGGRIVIEEGAKTSSLILSGGAIKNVANGITIADNAVFSGNVADLCNAIYNGAGWMSGREKRGQLTLGDAKLATYTDTVYNTGDIIVNGNVSFAGNVTLTTHTNSYGTSVGSLQNNGNIDFNISVRVEDDGLLLNDWELVSGDGTYSITVDDKQVTGEYQLIGNAANFNKTITVRNEDGSKKGELSLDMEEPLKLRNMSLMLKLDEETNIVSVIVDSEYSEATDREKQDTQVKLPDTAFAGMTYGDYTLTQAPDWLSIDPTTGKFSGTTGKISDTATGYGTTEVIITATKGEETKKHTIEVVVLPENIKGDGIIEESISGNMTDLIADAVANRNEDPYDSTLLTWLPFLPNKKIAWNYCGLDISLSELYYGVSVTDTDYIITLQGKLNFTIFDSGKTVDQRTSLTVDFSGEDKDESWSDYDGPKYIKVTTPHDFASVKFDVVGSMEFENFALGNGFLLKEGSISVDTERDIWSGSAEIEFTHFNKTIEAEFTVIGKRVDSLTVKVSGLNIAVGTTGFFINSIGGGVENISGCNDEPLTLIANMGLSYGKKITLIDGKEFYLVTADLEVSVSSESFTGSGDIEVLGGILSGNVSVTVDWKDSTFTAQGAVNLYKLATAQGCIKIDGSGNITYSAASILDFSQFGFGFSATANMLLNFSNDGNNSNDYYAAWNTREYCGIQQTFGVKFNLDGSWELLGTEKVKKINNDDNPITYSLRRSRSIPPVTGSWDLSGVSGIVLLSAQWESGETEFLLTDGNGNTYTKEDIAKRSDMEIVESMSNDKTLVIAVKDPVEGIWSLSIANGTNVEIDANILNGKSSVAAPSLTAEAGNGRDITITWHCPELPENAELCIYYDTDSSGNDGVLLAQIVPDENSGTYTWTVPDSLAGELRFYAVLSSPDLLPAVGTYTSAIAMEAKEQLVEVDSSGWTYVAEGSYVQNAGITAGGILEIDGGSLCGDTSVAKNSEIILDEAAVSGTLTLAGFMTVRSNIDASNGKITFDLTANDTESDYLIDDISLITGAPVYTIMVSADQAEGTYKLAQGASGFTGTVTVGDGSVTYGTVTVNGDVLYYNNTSYRLVLNEGDLTFEVTATEPILNGGKEGVTFANIPGTSFRVDYSKDQFATALQVETQTQAVDTYGLPAGTFQWQVTGSDGIVHQGEEIVSDKTTVPEELVSDGDGNMDLFFGNATGVWDAAYAARHLGDGTWEGTQEQLLLKGKNKIADVFKGSADANVLVLTDDSNGDALFVDDVYTALGEQARFAQIDEIRAGAGDDIVDMTSQRYAYEGSSIRIYGGDGNDTLWGSTEKNVLFGDAGNDRLVGASGNDILIGGSGNDSMHGGGGNDIFCFCSNWGSDTVEQLDSGSVTLWLAEGSADNWNADTLTYTDGTDSVTVKGCTEVTLRFGTEADLSAGAFDSAASEKIFEKKENGSLA